MLGIRSAAYPPSPSPARADFRVHHPRPHLVGIREFGGSYRMYSGRNSQLIEDGRVQITEAIPHDRDSFVEGLFIKQGFVYESQGLSGHSRVSVCVSAVSTRGCLPLAHRKSRVVVVLGSLGSNRLDLVPMCKYTLLTTCANSTTVHLISISHFDTHDRRCYLIKHQCRL